MSITESRTVHGVEVPAPGEWQIDPSHSTVEFVARHLVVAKVRGRFTDFDGVVHIADDPEASSVEVAVRTASVDTSDEQRDGHLRSPDFFASDEFPEMRYRSTSVRPAGPGRWVVSGDLTIRDVTRPVHLDLEVLGQVADPWGNDRAVYSAEAEVEREDWGLTWNQTLESGGVLVGKKVTLHFEIETVRATS